jgi:hypothetical protein
MTNTKNERQQWIKDNRPDVKWAFRGAMIFRLFEDAQDCYVGGNDLASILAGVSFFEQSLAAEFQSIHRGDIMRASLPDLAKEARKYGWISENDRIELDRIWRLRKSITHFRPPGHVDRIEARQYEDSTPIDVILEEEARHELTTLFHLSVNRTGFGMWSGQIPKNYAHN